MTDFGPMIANPSLVILGAAAHLGIFVALIGAKVFGFTLAEACSIGIIGGADGPMAIYTTMKLAPHLLPQISVAAYSYMFFTHSAHVPLLHCSENFVYASAGFPPDHFSGSIFLSFHGYCIMNDHIAKPIRPEQLIKALDKALPVPRDK